MRSSLPPLSEKDAKRVVVIEGLLREKIKKRQATPSINKDDEITLHLLNIANNIEKKDYALASEAANSLANIFLEKSKDPLENENTKAYFLHLSTAFQKLEKMGMQKEEGSKLTFHELEALKVFCAEKNSDFLKGFRYFLIGRLIVKNLLIPQHSYRSQEAREFLQEASNLGFSLASQELGIFALHEQKKAKSDNSLIRAAECFGVAQIQFLLSQGSKPAELKAQSYTTEDLCRLYESSKFLAPSWAMLVWLNGLHEQFEELNDNQKIVLFPFLFTIAQLIDISVDFYENLRRVNGTIGSIDKRLDILLLPNNSDDIRKILELYPQGIICDHFHLNLDPVEYNALRKKAKKSFRTFITEPDALIPTCFTMNEVLFEHLKQFLENRVDSLPARTSRDIRSRIKKIITTFSPSSPAPASAVSSASVTTPTSASTPVTPSTPSSGSKRNSFFSSPSLLLDDQKQLALKTKEEVENLLRIFLIEDLIKIIMSYAPDFLSNLPLILRNHTYLGSHNQHAISSEVPVAPSRSLPSLVITPKSGRLSLTIPTSSPSLSQAPIAVSPFSAREEIKVEEKNGHRSLERSQFYNRSESRPSRRRMTSAAWAAAASPSQRTPLYSVPEEGEFKILQPQPQERPSSSHSILMPLMISSPTSSVTASPSSLGQDQSVVSSSASSSPEEERSAAEPQALVGIPGSIEENGQPLAQRSYQNKRG